MTANIPDTTGPIVVGMGFATAATSTEIIALIGSCLAESGFQPDQLVAIGTLTRKQSSRVSTEVTRHFGVPLRLFDEDDLANGAPGVAEAVAAAAGPLRVRKRKSRYATCAIALCRPGFSLVDFGQPPSPSAMIASSIVATSSAGP